MKWLSFGILFFAWNAVAEPSVCFGTTAKGRLDGGVQLPFKGKNFVAYSVELHQAGRTFVHSEVRDIVISAYQALQTDQPNKVYQYAETGFQSGGEFKPHKTHRNGLSVDFMTPVVDANGESVHLPANAQNRYGYDIEFDGQGRYQQMTIDYPALAAHLVALDTAAKKRGFKLWRVIFDPALQPALLATPYGEYLKQTIQFSKKRSWVRHDEHYHVDFAIPCKPF